MSQAIRLSLAAALLGFGCNAPAPVTPAAAPPAVAPAAPLPPGPRIVGTVATNPPNAVRDGAIVYLEDGPKKADAPMTASIDIRDKLFTPFIQVVPVGGTVTFGNRDALTHHVFSPDIAQWDTGYLQKDQTVSRKFDAPGTFALLCNIHPEMIGYLAVVPSGYFARVGADGKYALGGLPPGTYKVTAWAPRQVAASQSVTVPASGEATANFELKAADRPAAPKP